MAVILGEAIWNLIVSIMNNLVVPWLGDLFGQSSGLPTSFTQRPYNYPDLFVSFLEFCIAGLVAAIINYFFQRPRAVRVKPGKSPVLVPPVEPVRLVPRTEAPAAQPQMVTAPATTAQPAQTPPTLTKSAPTTPVVKPDPIIPAAPVIAAPPTPVRVVAPTPIAKPSPVAPVPPPAAASVAKPQPAPPKAEPAKPKKSKEVYYNIVGEPMPSDED
jgi:hypothetical protein